MTALMREGVKAPPEYDRRLSLPEQSDEQTDTCRKQ